MGALVYNHGAYYAVFSVSNKKIWRKIGKVDKKEAKQILRKLAITVLYEILFIPPKIPS